MSHRHEPPRAAPIRDALAPAPEAPLADDVSLRRSVELPLWLVWARRWPLVVGIAVVAGLGGYLLSFMIPESYEASATLILTPANTQPASQVAAVTNARTLFENRALATTVIRELQISHGGRLLHPETLVRDRLKVAQIRDTNYLRLTLRLGSPEEAAKSLNTLIERGIQLNRQLTVENTTSVARGLLKAQLDEARVNLDRRTKDLETFRDAARLEVVRSDVEQAAALRSIIAELDGAIEFERARIAEGERQLSSRSRLLSTPRSSARNALLDSARREGEPDRPLPAPAVQPLPATQTEKPKPEVTKTEGTKPEGTKTQRTTSENGTDNPPPVQRKPRLPQESPPPDLPSTPGDPLTDPVYEVLDYQVTTGRNRLAALQAQRVELTKRGAGPLDQLYAGEAKLERLKLEHELASDLYKGVVLRYEQARESAMSQSASIQVADPATPPDGPAGPNRTLSAAVAGGFGLVLGLSFVLFSAIRNGLEPVARPSHSR
jgi:G-rich domain on putative tyrosine kinase